MGMTGAEYGKSLAFASLILHRSDGAGMMSAKTKKDILKEEELANEKAIGDDIKNFSGLKIYLGSSKTLAAACTAVNGISIKRSAIGINAPGCENIYIPGKISYAPAQLKKSIALEHFFYDWIMTGVYDYQVSRQDVKICFGNLSGEKKEFEMNYYFILKNAFPIKWQAPVLKMNYFQGEEFILPDYVFETITLQYSELITESSNN